MTKCITLLMVGFVLAVHGTVGVNESRAAIDVGLKFVNVSPGYSGTVAVTTPSYSTNTTAGQFNWTVTNSANSGGLITTSTLTTFCIELGQVIGAGENPTYLIVDDLSQAPQPGPGPLGTGGVGNVAYELKLLYDSQYDGLGTGTPTQIAENYAAFQLVIWELTHDPTAGNLSNGNFTASGFNSNAVAKASNWLTAVLNDTASRVADYTLYALTNNDSNNRYQDQLFALPNLPSSGVVPEATAMVTWAMILFSASVVSRPARRQEMA